MNKELAILFKKILYPNGDIEFIPIKTIEGIYNQKENTFIDKDGTPYFHIIENPDSYGYCYRDNLINYKVNYKHLTTPIIKSLLLRTIKKYTYTYNVDEETGAPIILFTSKKSIDEKNILLDEEITNYYMERFPEYYNKYLNPSTEETEIIEETEELDIKNIYENMTSSIIDQEETIKKILNIIWKQNQNTKTINKNIILDGPSGIGKSKICNLLVELLKVPSAKISSYEGKMKMSDYLILELVKKSGGDIAKAQNGIIIIDKFEDFIMYSSSDGRGELEKLLENNQLIISSTAGEFLFDTSNLIVIGLTNFEKIKPSKKQVTGFNGVIDNKKYEEILNEYFTTIKLNPLNYDSYIKILNSEEGLLNQNIQLLKSQGISLVIPDNIKHQIALLADSSKYKVKTLEEIIERTLELAEFEIASNPNQYTELIITKETLDNNKVYKLIKK